MKKILIIALLAIIVASCKSKKEEIYDIVSAYYGAPLKLLWDTYDPGIITPEIREAFCNQPYSLTYNDNNEMYLALDGLGNILSKKLGIDPVKHKYAREFITSDLMVSVYANSYQSELQVEIKEKNANNHTGLRAFFSPDRMQFQAIFQIIKKYYGANIAKEDFPTYTLKFKNKNKLKIAEDKLAVLFEKELNVSPKITTEDIFTCQEYLFETQDVKVIMLNCDDTELIISILLL